MKYITKASDLVTTKTATIEGFSWQANEKLERANSYISTAEYFMRNASKIKNIDDARKDSTICEFLIATCMLSKKSLSHLNIETQNELITKQVDFNKFPDLEYLKTLTQRYYLTSGDSLGGTMRNVVGQSAQDKLTESIMERLCLLQKSPERILNKKNKTVAIKWADRRVMFDMKPKFINNSVDIIVVKGNSAESGNLENPYDYLCCGELKGGIDPAGADEHWKTAKTALQRIASTFETNGLNIPKLVFLGAAIETAMSEEIYNLLSTGWLTGAANINYENQFTEVIDLIIS